MLRQCEASQNGVDGNPVLGYVGPDGVPICISLLKGPPASVLLHPVAQVPDGNKLLDVLRINARGVQSLL